MVEIIKFRDKKAYKQWLEEQPDEVKMKAKEYHEKFGNIPFVIRLCVEPLDSLRCEHIAYLFVNPKALPKKLEII